MMELLKRFEEDGTENDASLFSEEEAIADEERDLAKRLHGIDLGEYASLSRLLSRSQRWIESASPDTLWLALTPEERNRFLKALDEPSSELAQQLLASEALERTTQQPWWDAPATSDDTAASRFKLYGVRPDPMTIPSNMVKPFSGDASLIYNLCALW